MHRRDSIMNKSDTQPHPKNADLPLQEYHGSSTIEDFDATAAALSRLSVLAESSRTDGSASPLLNLDSTYETSTLSSCPSPAKRPSETFDTTLQSSDMKRLRIEVAQHSPLRDTSHIFAQDFVEVDVEPEHSCKDKLVGLGLNCALAPHATSNERPLLDENRPFTLDGCSLVSMHGKHRKRARSNPVAPSPRWLKDVSSKKKVGHSESKALNAVRHRHRDLSSIPKPPITQQTLKELELNEVFKNAQLRHDIVHDPNLQFRPNTDGERGAKKRHEANKYWRSVVYELDTIQSVPKSKLGRTRLSVMFQEMKDILLSLVPVSEKVTLEVSFDHELFLQTLSHGLFSVAAFAQFMSSLMKRHCAPMRDEAIDDTVRQIECATTSLDFVEALRSTFDVLEMMKLDVANHQLRTLRGYLLSTSIEFEKSWFLRKYHTGVQSIESGKSWFQATLPAIETQTSSLDYRACFSKGYTSLFSASAQKSQIPTTFNFDTSRIMSLKKDVRELVYLNLSLLIFKQTNKTCTVAELSAIKVELLTLMSTELSRSTERWVDAVPNIALQILRSSQGSSSNHTPLPSGKDLQFVISWLTTHMNEKSTIFSMVEARVLAALNKLVYHELTVVSTNGQKEPSTIDWGLLESSRNEVQNVSRRMAAVAEYHWKVHGSNYVQWSRT
ncbi:putative CAMP-mediated signaling protein Sok1 [Taphrina deformans PYCC 5710]|uniref:cAMP-mediated signaling protein Sok1 n=1 Tax=Taphrina deformans (strain PYCC 5710 / ATCC 11124 / CBS 356.35 / IMI 108563 / JCM 9778 / NBRC 8474) TaxID=1097556 RepID=R4XBM9_TAPDE|nr:putative CAMP-mediated signaling protein Sok1 [Taphrina deformans PYCC 5710]|eukprot:CCG83270.1 putative CAMP-mediated signaling protein Sok1 [Taphrina deformans PYCC 5710]